MELRHWRHATLDLADGCGYAERPELSVLANSVEALNARLLERLDRNASLLEVGCGSYSLLRERMKALAAWEGIDVIDSDRHGRPTIATRRASVEAIPWPAGSFDYVVSNQSVEHWHEYGVDIALGLAEIGRVLKEDGMAVINFPVHLHGHRMFVMGNFDQIDAQFAKAGLEVQERIAVIKSSIPCYRGWRLCGFPDFLVAALPSHESTSYVVEYMARRVQGMPLASDPMVLPLRPKPIGFQRHFHYGMKYLVWKIIAKLRGKVREFGSQQASQ